MDRLKPSQLVLRELLQQNGVTSLFSAKWPISRARSAILLAALALSGICSASNVTYEYDAQGRVSREVYDSGTYVTYSYDLNGNRTTSVLTDWYVQFRRPLIRMLSAKRVLPLRSIEDLVQQTFLRACSYSSHEPIENALGYLHTIAIHLASEWKERIALRAPHVSDEVLEQEPCGESDSPESALERIELIERVREALRGLTDRRREVMILRYRYELTYSEIGQRLFISERIVNRDVVKAHRGVRATLEANGAAESNHCG